MKFNTRTLIHRHIGPNHVVILVENPCQSMGVPHGCQTHIVDHGEDSVCNSLSAVKCPGSENVILNPKQHNPDLNDDHRT